MCVQAMRAPAAAGPLKNASCQAPLLQLMAPVRFSGLTRAGKSADRAGLLIAWATGAPVRLAAMEDSVDDVEPDLVPFGDALALLWARGSHIYVCGGCVPDHDLHAVLIDPASLDPLSQVVKVSSEQGGLLRRDVAVLDDDLLTTVEVTFHTSAEPAFASFHCE